MPVFLSPLDRTRIRCMLLGRRYKPMDTITAFCNTCDVEVEALGAFTGMLDGRPEYDLLKGNDYPADTHLQDGHEVTVGDQSWPK